MKSLRNKINKLFGNNSSNILNDMIDDFNSDSIIEHIPPQLIEKKQSCINFWCKATFTVKYYEDDECPKTCHKCNSFNNELSNGVESEVRHYEGLRQDGEAHETDYIFSEYKNGKGFWNK